MPTDNLTLREASVLLKKHRNVLHRWMRKGLVPFAQPGGERGRYVFSRQALLAFLREQAEQAATPRRKRDEKSGPRPQTRKEGRAAVKAARADARAAAKAAEKAAKKAADVVGP